MSLPGWHHKTSDFPIILEGMNRFLEFLHKNDDIYEANCICKVHTDFTHGRLEIARNCDSEHIRNTFIFFAFNKKIHENKVEFPIQILDYSQVLSYQNRFVK